MYQARKVLAFIVVAMTSVLPYSLYMNAHEYFYYKLRNATDSSGNANDDFLTAISAVNWNHTRFGRIPTTDLQRAYEGWFTVTSGITCILGSLLNTVATNRLSNGFRVMTGHAIVLLSLVPTLFYTLVDTDENQTDFFWLTMFFSSISSFASIGLIGAGIAGLAATYSESYMQVVMFGYSVAGICSSVLSILCQAATDNSILNGRIYFGIAFLWTLLSVVCYYSLVSANHDKTTDDDDRLLEDQEEEHIEEAHTVDSEESSEVISDAPMNSPSLFAEWGGILQKTAPDMMCAMFVVLVTCAAFPALASQVRPQITNATWRAYFSSVCCFLLYSCSDALGRVFASRISISRAQLQNLSLARLLLLPLITVCDVQPRHHSPTLIRNDAVFILLIMLLALSNAFCYTHAYVKAVQRVDPSQRETAGSMMSVAGNTISLIACIIGVAIVAAI